MKSSRLLWGSVGIVSALATVLFFFGLIYAVNEILFPQPSHIVTEPAASTDQHNPLAQNKIQLVALGDSLSLGTGDQTGKGYVGDLKELLQKETNRPTYILGNFSVNGYRTDQLLNDIQHNKGIRLTLAKANIIVLTIGGNDLFQAANIGNSIAPNDAAFEINFAEVKKRLPDAMKRLKEILRQVEAANPQATILYIGLYNPFLDFDKTGQGSLMVQQWNNAAFETANQYANMTFVPTFDLFEKNLLKYLYSDHFHPNEEGYRRMAERIMQILR